MINFFKQIFGFILHVDEHLVTMICQYGNTTYGILFLIIFAETGLVVTPFLPGDSLIFAAGALAASTSDCSTGGTASFELWTLCLVLMVAAFVGNMTNFFIGRRLGPAVFNKDKSIFFKKEYLLKTQAFYEKHGAMAIILSRYLPIMRTFVPFVAGVGQMNVAKFTRYTLLSSVGWVVPVAVAGYCLGTIPFFKNNFELVVIIIILVSIVPTAIAFLKEYFNKNNP